MKKFFKIFFRILLIIIIIAVVGIAAGGVYLTLNEYSPEDTETVEVSGTAARQIAPGTTVSLLTYNIGFGISDSQHDSYEDGGQTVIAESEDIVTANMSGIVSAIISANPDIFLLQEVDRNSKRSLYADEVSYLEYSFSTYNSVFANTRLVSYVPLPISLNMLGKVDSGIMTIAPFAATDAQRVSLVNTDSWPESVYSEKECMLVESFELTNSTKELVVINVQLTDKSADETIEQYKELCDYIKIEYAKGNYVIVGGDFNALLPSVSTSTDSTDIAVVSSSLLISGWKYATDTSTATARVMDSAYDASDKDARYYVTDGFICSPNVIIEDVHTIDTLFEYSDHNPVMASFTLNK